MNYCKDCKYCELNQKFIPPKTKGIFGWFKRLKAYLDFQHKQEIILASSTPDCLHPDVYKYEPDFVFGEIKKRLSCNIAREDPTDRYFCCGKTGLYFEKIDK